MDAPHIQQIQKNIVRAVAGNVTDVRDGEWEDREWAHLFVDIEIAQDGGRQSSLSFALAHKPGRPLEKLSFRLPQDAGPMFDDLAEAMRRPGEDRWSNAQLRLERDGRYAFTFNHEPPWRLSGNLIDRRFEGYLDHWLSLPEGQQFAQSAKIRQGGLWGKLNSLRRPSS